MYCGGSTQVKHGENGLSARPLRCRAWTCDHCAPQRKKQLIALGFAGKPNRFLTLTVNPALYNSQARRAEMLSRAWRLLRKRIRRKFHWDRVPFLAVVERQKSGEPHLHILLRCPYLPQAWISEQMRDLIGAPIVDIRWITDQGRVAAYIVKYCGKDPHRFPNTKRYWRSPDWQLESYLPDDGITGAALAWTIEPCQIGTWIEQQRAAGSLLAEASGWVYALARAHKA